jgi:hypothetical protein
MTASERKKRKERREKKAKKKLPKNSLRPEFLNKMKVK